MMDRTAKIKIVLPFLLIVIAISSGRIINFSLSLTPSEVQLEKFTSKKLELPLKKQGNTGNLNSPFEAASVTALDKASAEISKDLLKELVTDTTQTASMATPDSVRVSVIVVSKNHRMAIVNGNVVREGDKLGQVKITKIERERVLVTEFRQQGTGDIIKKWVYLEEKS